VRGLRVASVSPAVLVEAAPFLIRDRTGSSGASSQAPRGTKEKDMPKRTITMTGRPPIQIAEEDWPIIASSKHTPGSFVNGTPRPKYEHDTYKIMVRAHKDGRTIVYGILDGATAWTGTEDRRAGYLLDREAATAAGIVHAIRAVAKVLGQYDDEDDTALVADCIADLPAEEV
jgi:hypothetical protein